jgi:hypothetical protein
LIDTLGKQLRGFSFLATKGDRFGQFTFIGRINTKPVFFSESFKISDSGKAHKYITARKEKENYGNHEKLEIGDKIRCGIWCTAHIHYYSGIGGALRTG